MTEQSGYSTLAAPLCKTNSVAPSVVGWLPKPEKVQQLESGRGPKGCVRKSQLEGLTPGFCRTGEAFQASLLRFEEVATGKEVSRLADPRSWGKRGNPVRPKPISRKA